MDKRPEYQKEQDDKKRFETIPKSDVISTLVDMYIKDESKIYSNYKYLAEMDKDLLKELGIDKTALCKSMFKKLNYIKKMYWGELFSRLSSIYSSRIS